jgi:hypothetical protein
MTHRAQQIVEQIQDLLQASTSLGVNPENVFAMRSISISESDGQLPAITIEYGDDNNVPTSQFNSVWSELAIRLTVYDRQEDEPALHQSLLNIRSQIESILGRDVSLGLVDVVLMTKYESTSAPEFDSTSDKIVGRFRSNWRVTYVLNSLTPFG